VKRKEGVGNREAEGERKEGRERVGRDGKGKNYLMRGREKEGAGGETG